MPDTSDAFDQLRRVIGRRMNELDDRLARAQSPAEVKAIERSRAEVKLIWARFLTVGTIIRRRRQ